jgi:outer membrane protein TolC
MSKIVLTRALTGFAVLAMAATVLARADQAIPLAQFETQVDQSLTLQAAQMAVDETKAALLSAEDRSGPALTSATQIGPRRDVVDSALLRTYTRFEEDLGVKIPLLGSHTAQQEAIAVAKTQNDMARLDYEQTKLQLVAKLRQTYISYYEATRRQAAAEQFVDQLNAQQAATSALRKNGFWTEADELRYSTMIQRAQTDEARAAVAQTDALQQLSLLTNSPVHPFTPAEPAFAACAPAPDAATFSAYSQDVELQKIAVAAAEIQALAPLERWDGFDTNLNVGALSYLDKPGGVGYGFYVGADFVAPIHATRLKADEEQRAQSAMQQYRLLAEARKAELHTGVMVALDDRSQAVQELAQAERDHLALAEDLRESRVRFAFVAPTSLGDVQQKAQTDYQAQVAMIADQAQIWQKTADLLQLAPNACSPTASVPTHEASK